MVWCQWSTRKQPSLCSWFIVGSCSKTTVTWQHVNSATLAWWCVCRCRLDLYKCLHLSRDLYRPPQATVRNTLLLCTRGLWEEWCHLALLLACVSWFALMCRYAFCVTERAQLVHMWLAGLYWLSGCQVCMRYHHCFSNRLINECAFLLVWIISPVCVNIF